MDRFGHTCIAGVVADREFIGRFWIAWLRDTNIPFCIRLKHHLITTNRREQTVKIESWFRDLTPGEQRLLDHPRRLGTQWVYLSGTRSPRGERVILATDQRLLHPFAL
jgi:hypothetical protein